MESNKGIEYITQLSDAKPRFDRPIRITLPLNAPNRVDFLSNDKFLSKNVFSSTAISTSLLTLSGFDNNSHVQLKSPLDLISSSNQDAESLTAISDYNSVAYSNKRLGKRNIEGNSYVSLGVIYDNQAEYLKAIDQYMKYLDISQSSEFEDVVGVIIACNCISVDYILLASPPSECGTIDGVISKSPAVMTYVDQAIHYSQRHIELTQDDGGRFVAHTNLGLCYGMKGDLIQAGKHQQDALRISIKMQTLYGQSIAVGNLGLIALKKNDLPTAKTCFQQHIQLVQALNDKEAEIKAYNMLAEIYLTETNYQEALNTYENSIMIAEREGYLNELRHVTCLVGIAKGKKDFYSYMKSNSSIVDATH